MELEAPGNMDKIVGKNRLRIFLTVAKPAQQLIPAVLIFLCSLTVKTMNDNNLKFALQDEIVRLALPLISKDFLVTTKLETNY